MKYYLITAQVLIANVYIYIKIFASIFIRETYLYGFFVCTITICFVYQDYANLVK